MAARLLAAANARRSRLCRFLVSAFEVFIISAVVLGWSSALRVTDLIQQAGRLCQSFYRQCRSASISYHGVIRRYGRVGGPLLYATTVST